MLLDTEGGTMVQCERAFAGKLVCIDGGFVKSVGLDHTWLPAELRSFKLVEALQVVPAVQCC